MCSDFKGFDRRARCGDESWPEAMGFMVEFEERERERIFFSGG